MVAWLGPVITVKSESPVADRPTIAIRQSLHVSRYERRRRRPSYCLSLGDCRAKLSHSSHRPKIMAHRETHVLLLIACCFILFLPDNCRSTWNPQDCPSFCECFPRYGLRWTECAGRRLYSIHTGVNKAVQALDLSNNSIASLNDYEIRDADLAGLKLLNLSSNAISEIGLLAFADLDDLRVLDISYNHLYYIQSDTFVNNKRLEVLELAGNNLNGHVPNLRSSSLASLGLAGCRISHLSPNIFDNLPRLRALDLSNNMMILLEADVLLRIPNLAVLVLERNPWFCNNDMFELQDSLKDKGVVFKAVCSHNEVPRSKTGPKKFEKMIALEIATPESTVLGSAGRLLTKIKNWRNSWKPEATTADLPPLAPTSNSESSSLPSWTRSPYLFITIGFLLGAAFSTVVTYFWMTRTISRSVRNLRRQAIRADLNQRVSLLQHLWQNNENRNRTTTECPGTPPPPYRDVMLNARRYPRPHIQAIR